ncbi:MAG: hypothetical protein NVS3B26_12560 [Mycobacteriales bacterium]
MPLALLFAAQRIRGLDTYDVLGSALTLLAGFALLVRSRRRPEGERGLRGHRVDELLLTLLALGLSVLVLHQLVTDGLCHGGCLSVQSHPVSS